MPALANVNGQSMPLEEVRISPLDRGFLFGDSVYEVVRICQGKPYLEDEHFARLARSLESIRIQGVDSRLRARRAKCSSGPQPRIDPHPGGRCRAVAAPCP